MKKRWKIILTTLSTLVLITVTGGLYAYLADADSADNTLTVGGINTEIVEEFEPPSALAPGVSFTKNVKVKNLGPNDAYIRIKAVFTDSDMEKYCIVDFNTTDFVYNEDDGFYYYINPMTAGEVSESLFTNVTIMPEIDEDGDGTFEEVPMEAMKDFDILIYTEAYQTGAKINGSFRDFKDYEEAWKHYRRNYPENN